jgi:hypothetical protein
VREAVRKFSPAGGDYQICGSSTSLSKLNSGDVTRLR